ncbi:mercury resistance system transport protein MerF [uncultured Tateyamaria sp.]|uniref:mercury resistance system transport protein MerF n=1 Tax=uncultured Tateyamaria sp. TaxID=455651 RepID=UPI002618DE77|nr:mercury resistance system transport protein MerF [uncultured Tateyamaria sp.]
MDNRKLLRIGAIGTVVTALCCFTPLLVIVLSAIGLAGVIAYLDLVLLPLLGLFVLVLITALIRKVRSNG